MRIPYYHIDSFTSEVFAGNPAGVCFPGTFPGDRVMQKIAAENRHSETAFVVERGNGEFGLRWFTPEVEDDLCGHATLASAYALALRGHKAWPVRFHTLSGVLSVRRDGKRFEMDFPSRAPAICETPAGLLPALGVTGATVMRSSRDFLVVVDSVEIVSRLKPDIAALAKMEMGIGGAMVTAQGRDDVDYVCRFFPPSVGISEDPATGSIQCTLAPYWAERTGKRSFHVKQLSARGGEMWCAVAGDRVKIAGEAALYMEGAIEI